MSFFINSINPFAFAGQIIAYLGTTDPDGWVICDGTQRPWDDKYQSLVNMSIGAKNGEGTKYIPPDLSNCILRGKDSVNSIKTISGSNSNVSVNINHFPNHDHGTKDSNGVQQTRSHTHTYNDYYFDNEGSLDQDPKSGSGNGDPHKNDKTGRTTGASSAESGHSVTIGETGTNDNVSISIQNYGYRVYWILKY